METQLELAGGAGPFARGARYNGYGAFLRERFGCRVYKVIVDAGFTCPNRDGTVAIGGCTYCNNDSFRPQAVNRLKPIPEQVHTGVAYLKRRYRAQKFVVYFQPFTNTYAPLETLIPLYESSLDHPEVIGLAVGTRLDCLKLQRRRAARPTALRRAYSKQPSTLLGYQEYVDLVVDFLERLNPEIRIERLFGLAPEDQLLRPHWGRTKAEIQYDIEQALVRRNTHQGRFYGRIESGG